MIESEHTKKENKETENDESSTYVFGSPTESNLWVQLSGLSKGEGVRRDSFLHKW